MVEFASIIELLTGQLPQSSSTASLRDQVNQLKCLIERKASAGQVAALTGTMRTILIKSHGLTVAPDKMPNLERGKALYMANCVACHGLNGDGKGPASEILEPKPTNFLDTSRYEKRSLYGLFNTITYGVEGTAMTDFSSLTNAERWDLAAFVGQLGVPDDAPQRGEKIWLQLKDRQKAVSTDLFTTLSPEEAALQWEKGSDLMAYLRQSPEVLFARDASPISFAQNMIRESYQAYQNGNKGLAYEKALSAYLDGFELVEASLAAIDTPLLKETERAMAQYRNFMQKKAAPPVITAQYQKLLPLLDQAQ
jgi:high-affinity iron transporter